MKLTLIAMAAALTCGCVSKKTYQAAEKLSREVAAAQVEYYLQQKHDEFVTHPCEDAENMYQALQIGIRKAIVK